MARTRVWNKNDKSYKSAQCIKPPPLEVPIKQERTYVAYYQKKYALDANGHPVWIEPIQLLGYRGMVQSHDSEEDGLEWLILNENLD